MWKEHTIAFVRKDLKATTEDGLAKMSMNAFGMIRATPTRHVLTQKDLFIVIANLDSLEMALIVLMLMNAF